MMMRRLSYAGLLLMFPEAPLFDILHESRRQEPALCQGCDDSQACRVIMQDIKGTYRQPCSLQCWENTCSMRCRPHTPRV